MTQKQPTDAEIAAAWTKAIADQNRVTDAQRRLPAVTGEEASLSAEDLAWKRALALVQGGAL